MTTTTRLADLAAKYAKFVVALITAVGATTIAALITGAGSPEMWVTAIVTLLTAAGVYVFPDGSRNWQSGIKTLVALIGAAGTTTIVSLVQGDISTEALIIAVVAVLGVVGTYTTPNVQPGTQLVAVPKDETLTIIREAEGQQAPKVLELERGRQRVDPATRLVVSGQHRAV